jgi:hypothetical protein
MGNRLVSNINLAKYKTKVLEITFSGSGLDGSKKASLSYEPLAAQGHIWLVDKTRDRNCKGEWFLNKNNQYSWKIKCFDGLIASGALTSPLKQTGTGKGKDNFSKKVNFIFTQKLYHNSSRF